MCIASTQWNFIWQRPQQLMSRICMDHRVLFINHSFPLRYDKIKLNPDNPQLWEKYLHKKSDNLWVFWAFHLCDLTGEISLKKFNYNLKAKYLNFLTKKLDFGKPIIITYLPESIEYLNNIKHKLLIYDCVDNFSSFTWAERETELQDNKLIRKADLVTTTAKNLLEKIKKINKKVYYLPNAVDFNHFNKVSIRGKVGVTSKFKKGPVIGFVGAFYDWVDEELIKFLATAKPDWNFLFIGPIQPGIGIELSGKDNIIFMGEKSYYHLPKYISVFDVCFIPFKVNEVTKNANPIKMWEYMATGKPIVSTPIPEVKKMNEYIYIGKDKKDFLAKIEQALTEDDEIQVLKRIMIAKENDWSIRTNKLLKLLNE